MIGRLLAALGHKRSIRTDAARRVKECFDGVNWGQQSFRIDSGPCLSCSSGETKFYEVGEIDAAIKRLNVVLAELSKQ